MGQSISDTIRQSDRIRIDLIGTELDLAATFTQIAFQSGDDAEKRARNAHHAREAYDAVLRLASQSTLSDTEVADLQAKVADLRFALIELGEANL